MARSGLKFAALAAAGLSLCAPLAQALNVTEAFDGSYFNPAQSGRGVLVDVIPGALGSVTFFAAGFTYDNAGGAHVDQIPRGKDGQFYFKLTDPKGRVLLQSTGFTSPRDAGQVIARLQSEGPATLDGLAGHLAPLPDVARADVEQALQALCDAARE